MHTFTNRAQHESNGLVGRKIGMLNEAVRAALLASDLPAYLWPEVYMAMFHTQNLGPSSALQREWRKVIKRQEEYEQGEMNQAAEADAAGQDCCVIYMHTKHAWLTVQMLWQMHGRTLQAVHMLIVCMEYLKGINHR